MSLTAGRSISIKSTLDVAFCKLYRVRRFFEYLPSEKYTKPHKWESNNPKEFNVSTSIFSTHATFFFSRACWPVLTKFWSKKPSGVERRGNDEWLLDSRLTLFMQLSLIVTTGHTWLQYGTEWHALTHWRLNWFHPAPPFWSVTHAAQRSALALLQRSTGGCKSIAKFAVIARE